MLERIYEAFLRSRVPASEPYTPGFGNEAAGTLILLYVSPHTGRMTPSVRGANGEQIWKLFVDPLPDLSGSQML